MSLDPFDYISLAHNFVTKDGAIRDVAASMYAVIRTISMIGMAFTICITALKLTSSSGHVFDEVKSGIGYKAIVMIVTFALPYLLSTIMSVTTKL